MALGDYKRTSKDNKTISIAQPNEALRNPPTLIQGGMSRTPHPTVTLGDCFVQAKILNCPSLMRPAAYKVSVISEIVKTACA